MKTYSVNLKETYGTEGGFLHCIVAQNPFDHVVEWSRPAVIVVPGGAYCMVSKREGEPVAMEFLARGFQTFVLEYSTSTDGFSYPTQLIELASAVNYVRSNAYKLRVNADQIFVVGFSAGGHLTGNLAVQWQDVEGLCGKKFDCKPTAVGLCYPVITNKAGYLDTHENLLQGYSQSKRNQLLKTLNLDQSVSKQTPPSFVWTTATDNVVPSQNSLLYALACANNQVPYELHVYPCGEHGLSTCSEEINTSFDQNTRRNAKWIDDCAAFFKLFCN